MYSQICQKRLLASSCLAVCNSVSPHGTTLLPLDGYLWNLYLRIVRKSVKKIKVSLNSDKNNMCSTWSISTNLWWYLAEFFEEWEIFQIEFVEKGKTHNLRSITFSKSCLLWHNIEKCGRAIQAADDSKGYTNPPQRYVCIMLPVWFCSNSIHVFHKLCAKI